MPVSIRPPVPSDTVPIWEAARESIAEISPWMGWCHEGYTAADSAAWIEKSMAGHVSGASYEFIILDSDGVLAGCCGINHINRVDGFANVSYWVRTSRAGRGITPVAVTRLLAWGFANTDLHRLEIVAAVGNTRSQRVAEKVGAQREGVLRHRLIVGGRPSDAYLYSVLRFDRIPDFTTSKEQAWTAEARQQNHG